MNEDHVMLTVLARQGETANEFSQRLSHFWTQMLRGRPDDFEKVYAEEAQFGDAGGRLSRRYLAELDTAGWLGEELRAAGLDFEPIDEDDLYSRYEATSPDWMQIEH